MTDTKLSRNPLKGLHSSLIEKLLSDIPRYRVITITDTYTPRLPWGGYSILILVFILGCVVGKYCL